MSIELVMLSNHLILLPPFPPTFNLSQHQGHMSQFFASVGQSTGVSALASALPMNIQDWFPLGWTGWISLQSKGLSRVFSNSTVQMVVHKSSGDVDTSFLKNQLSHSGLRWSRQGGGWWAAGCSSVSNPWKPAQSHLPGLFKHIKSRCWRTVKSDLSGSASLISLPCLKLR